MALSQLDFIIIRDYAGGVTSTKEYNTEYFGIFSCYEWINYLESDQLTELMCTYVKQ